MAAKKGTTNTAENELKTSYELAMRDVKDNLRFIPEPTYFYNVGDEVRFGAMKKAVVEEIIENGKGYILRCIATDRNYGNPYDYETYRFATWLSVRPVGTHTEIFTKNEDVKLRFSNCTIESLLHKIYNFGVDMEPDYQRGYVWSDEDREYLLDSIFSNIDIGKFAFIHLDSEEWHKRGYSYEVLDGKQRLHTLCLFYENRIPYKGVYFNDLCGKDRNTFMEHDVTCAEIENSDKKTIYKYFLMLNRGGKQMDKSQLENVEKLYQAEKEKV